MRQWLRELADDVHDHGAAVMIQMTHMGSRTNWNKADWLPIIAASGIPEPAHRHFPKVMEDWDFDASFAPMAMRRSASAMPGWMDWSSKWRLSPGRPFLVRQAPTNEPMRMAASLDNRMRLIRRHPLRNPQADRTATSSSGSRMVNDEQMGGRPVGG